MAREIDSKAIKVHSQLMEFVEKTYPAIRGSLLLGHYNNYFELRSVKHRYTLEGLVPTTNWIHEWGEFELEETIYHGSSTQDGSYRIKWRDPKYALARQRLISSVPELYCLSVKQKEIVHLIELCLPYTAPSLDMDRSKCKAFFDLVEIDSTFVTANWASTIIRNAEFASNKSFFRKLARALQRPGFRQDMERAKFGLATILLWYLGGKRLKHFKFLEELDKLGYKDKWNSVTAFPKFLNRLGLRKYAKVRQTPR